MRTHVVIPDTQAKKGVPADHLGWIGQYIVDQFAPRNARDPGTDLEIIHIGDHADMPSLSSYDKGKKAMEGRRIDEDIDAANAAFDELCRPLEQWEARARKRAPEAPVWRPNRRITLGNHEDRITRACENDAQLDGLLSLDDLNYAAHGWIVHPFLEPVELDGVTYAHYFYHPNNGRAYSGENTLLRLKNIGYSFTMGHQQVLQYAIRFVGGRSQHGLIAGACYLHEEEYRGPQAQAHWRGIVVCHQVEGGSYDPMFVSLDYLCRKYEGVRLEQFTAKRF